MDLIGDRKDKSLGDFLSEPRWRPPPSALDPKLSRQSRAVAHPAWERGSRTAQTL